MFIYANVSYRERNGYQIPTWAHSFMQKAYKLDNGVATFAIVDAISYGHYDEDVARQYLRSRPKEHTDFDPTLQTNMCLHESTKVFTGRFAQDQTLAKQ